MPEEETENESDEEQSEEETPVPVLPAEVSIISRILADNAAAFAQVSEMVQQMSQVGVVATQMFDSLPMQEMLKVQDALGGAVAKILSSYEGMQPIFDQALRIQEIMGAIQMPEIQLPKMEPIAPPVLGAAVLRLQSTVSDLSHIRARVVNHEERLLAIEKVIRELRDLVKDPELPEELKVKVKELLKNVQDLDYVG